MHMGYKDIERVFGMHVLEIDKRVKEYMKQITELMCKTPLRVKVLGEFMDWLNSGDEVEKKLKAYTVLMMLDLTTTCTLLSYRIHCDLLKLANVLDVYVPYIETIRLVVEKSDNPKDNEVMYA